MQQEPLPFGFWPKFQVSLLRSIAEDEISERVLGKYGVSGRDSEWITKSGLRLTTTVGAEAIVEYDEHAHSLTVVVRAPEAHLCARMLDQVLEVRRGLCEHSYLGLCSNESWEELAIVKPPAELMRLFSRSGSLVVASDKLSVDELSAMAQNKQTHHLGCSCDR